MGSVVFLASSNAKVRLVWRKKLETQAKRHGEQGDAWWCWCWWSLCQRKEELIDGLQYLSMCVYIVNVPIGRLSSSPVSLPHSPRMYFTYTHPGVMMLIRCIAFMMIIIVWYDVQARSSSSSQREAFLIRGGWRRMTRSSSVGVISKSSRRQQQQQESSRCRVITCSMMEKEVRGQM